MAEQVYDKEPGEDESTKGLRGLAGRLKGYRQDYKDFKNDGKDRDQAAKDRGEELGGLWRDSQEDSAIDPKGLNRSISRRLGVGIFRHKKLVGLTFVVGTIAAMFAFSGFFSVFKMDHIMSNIDAQSFARLQGGLDVRNTAYVRTYMELRLSDICTKGKSCASINVDKDNLIFRSPGVRRSMHPLYNWYRTLRSGNFEKDIFQKHGIFLTGGAIRDPRTGVLTHRLSVFTINGDAINMSSEINNAIKTSIKGGKAADPTELVRLYQDGVTFDKFFDEKVLTKNSEKRAAIKALVKANTQWWNVFKRRQLRKDLASRTGVTKFRFFDDTRQKVDNKKIQIRNRIIDAATPNNTKTGKFINCFFGISDCVFSPDTASPSNTAESIAGDKTRSPKTTDSGDVVDFTDAKNAVQKIIGRTSRAMNPIMWLSLLDSAAKIDENISNGALAAQVAIARGIQAMSLYQTFETVRDQMKTGEVNSEQVNQFMSDMANVTAAEAWIKAIDGNGNPSKLDVNSGNSGAKKFCSLTKPASENQFAYLCNNTVIGGVSGASQLSKGYKNSAFHKVLGPVFQKVHSIFGGVISIINTVLGSLFDKVFEGVLATVKYLIPPLYRGVQDALTWAMTEMVTWLGLMPIITSTTTSGQAGNWLVQGGAFAAESSIRDNGASATTPANRKLAVSNATAFAREESSRQSFFSKYLSPSNQSSPVSNSLFAVTQLKPSSLGNVFSGIPTMFRSISSALTLPFNHRVLAANTNFGYRAAQVAQIQTFDFPRQCLNQNPLAMTIADPNHPTAQELSRFTNLLGPKLFPGADISKLTENVLTNNTAWYKFLYDIDGANSQLKNSSGGTIVKGELVYNCALLDNSVRGGLGYLYGYTNDNGYGQ